MRAQRKIAVIVTVLLAGWTGCIWADVAALVDDHQITVTRFGPGNSIGWRFFVDKEITLTHLGLYDAGEAGLAGTHVMGIWRVKKEGGLRLERCVDIGPGGVAEDQHVYVDLAEPLTIVPDPVPYISGGVEYFERWLVGVWSPTGSGDLRCVQPQSAGTLVIAQAGVIRLENYTYKTWTSTPDTTLGDALLGAQTWYPWGWTSTAEHFGVNFKYSVPGGQPNQPPVAVDDGALTQVNLPVTIDVLANDSDPDGDPLAIASYTQGANGEVTSAESGLTYTPDTDFSGTDNFTYTIEDDQGATATATVIVTVNRPPVAAPDADQTEVGQAVTIAVLENDRDDDGDPLTVIRVGAAAHGSVDLHADSTVTYTPEPGFTGQDEFSYTISDGKGGTDTATVFVAVSPKTVPIDIKPGSYPNSINLGSQGVVPVAILSTADFDATTVDPATVSLAGARVAVRGKANKHMVSEQDVNEDGRPDLILQIETENLDPSQLQDGCATVVGTTRAGMPIIGTDEITIVPAK